MGLLPVVIVLSIVSATLTAQVSTLSREQFMGLTASSLAERLEKSRDLVIVQRLIDLEDPVAIPSLEKAFDAEDFGPAKDVIAAALVSLRSGNRAYFDHLASRLDEVIQFLDAPIVNCGERDKNALRVHDDGLKVWANGKSAAYVSKALDMAHREGGGIMFAIGRAADVRFAPRLRTVLESKNCLLAGLAAKSLARLQDRESIGKIISRCRGSSREVAGFICAWLAFFDDPAAREAYDLYVPEPQHSYYRKLALRGPKAAFYE